MSCSRSDHKMIEYLTPSQLFVESMKQDYYNPVFLAFSFRDDHASVAISEDFLCYARPHSKLPRDKTLFSRLIDVIHSVQNDPVEKYELLGIVVGNVNPVENIHKLMADLCERGNFESLKYTCWKDDITSENSSWDRNPSWSFFWRRITFPEEYSNLHKQYSNLHKHSDLFAATKMLRMFLEFFDALYMDEFEEMEDGDEEGEDKYLEMEDGDEEGEDRDLEMEDSERKMIKMNTYLKPSQFFQETMESNFYMLVLPVYLGFSFNDEFVTVAISDRYLNARSYCFYWRDEILWDGLLAIVKSFYNDPVGIMELRGIIVDDHNSVKDIHNHMDDLYKKGNFKRLKYTCWKDDIGSKNSTWDLNLFSAQHMLQRFLDIFKALYSDKDEDSERKKWCKIIQPRSRWEHPQKFCEVNLLKFCFGKYEYW